MGYCESSKKSDFKGERSKVFERFRVGDSGTRYGLWELARENASLFSAVLVTKNGAQGKASRELGLPLYYTTKKEKKERA